MLVQVMVASSAFENVGNILCYNYACVDHLRVSVIFKMLLYLVYNDLLREENIDEFYGEVQGVCDNMGLI